MMLSTFLTQEGGENAFLLFMYDIGEEDVILISAFVTAYIFECRAEACVRQCHYTVCRLFR